MSIAKKSIKWLVAAFVIFALILSASLAVGGVTKANAEPEPVAETTAASAVVIEVTDSVGNVYPDLANVANETRTLTVKYYVEIPAAAQSNGYSEMKFSPVLVYPSGREAKPNTVTLNNALNAYADLGLVANYVAGTELEETNAFAVFIKDGATIGQVNGATSDGNDGYTLSNYLFQATYVLSYESNEDVVGAYEFILADDPTDEDDGSEITPFDEGVKYIPEITEGEFTISAIVEYPTITTTSFVYGGPNVERVLYDGTNAGYTYTGATGTNVDDYTAVFTLNAYYIWHDTTATGGYTRADHSVAWEITKMQIDIPEEDATVFTYNGEAQNYTVAASDYYTVDGTPQTHAGNYDITISLVDTANTEWKDAEAGKEIADIVYEFVIAKLQIAIPEEGNENYVYNGNPQTYAFAVAPSSTYVEITDGTKTAAGIYSPIASLKNTADTEWTDGTTAAKTYTDAFEISKAAVAVPADFTVEYDGETHGVATNALYNIQDGNGSTVSASTVGDYETILSLADSDNYAWENAGTEDQTVEWSITPKAVVTPVIDTTSSAFTASSGNGYVYDAQSHEIYWTSASTPANALASYSGDKYATNVGNYTATWTLTDKTNYVWASTNTSADIDYDWFIEKKVIEKPTIEQANYTYTGSAQSYSDTTTWYSFTGSGTNAGQYPVTVSLVDTDNTKWNDDTTESYEAANKIFIGPKSVTLTLTVSPNTHVYGQTPGTVTVTANGLVNEGDLGTISYDTKIMVGGSYTHYTPSEFEAGLDVGSYILTPTYSTANGNYSVSEPTAKPYTITPASVTIPVADTEVDYEYDGTEQTFAFTAASTVDSALYNVANDKRTLAGSQTVTVTLINNNYQWADETTAAKTYQFVIAKMQIDIPDEDETTFYYNGSAQTYTVAASSYYTVSGNVQTEIGEYTVTIALSDTANTEWEDGTIDALEYDFVILTPSITVNFTYSYAGDVKTVAENVEITNIYTATMRALPTVRFFKTAGWKVNGEGDVVTAYTLAMDGQTLNAEFTYAVGAGDVNGDGVVSSADVIQMRRWNVGLDRAKKIANAATAWTKAHDANFTSGVLYTAMDANSSGGFSGSDIVATREALATGYNYKIIIEQGIVRVKKTNRVEVDNYADLVANIEIGNAVTLTADIEAANEVFNEDLAIPVDIYLDTYRLTVKGFTLNTNTAGATLRIAGDAEEGGIIYTVTGITVTAPNGNVVVANVNGYSYDGTVVNLAAYSESLHIEDSVAFFIYKAQLPGTETDYDDVDHFLQEVYDNAETTSEIVTALSTLATTRIGETEARMADIAEIKADTSKNETEKAEAINALDVKKAILEVPIDTHVVVEESAKLSAEKIVVKAQSDTTAPAVTTFAIEVKNAEAEVVTVDISEVKDDTGVEVVYVVDEVAISGNTSKVEVVAGENTAAEVKKYVAQIGSTGYESLQAAIDAAVNGDTVKLLASVANGTGIKTADDNKQKTKVGKTFTIDFNGFTYTVDGAGVGSSGTETQAMHWGEKDTITLKNGSLVISVKGATVPNPANNKIIKMAMQNYANLTVKNMTLDFSNIVVRNYGTYTGKDAPYSGLEIPLFNLNDGSMLIEDTTITMPNDSTKGVLIEIPDAATIKNSTINGYVSLGQFTANVTIINTTTSGVVSYFAGNSVITEGNLYSLINGIAVTTAAELQAALNAGAATIQVMNDFTASSPIMVYSSVVIEGRGHTLTSTAGRTLRVDASTPANSVVEIKDYSLINTCLSATGNVRGVQFDSNVNNVTLILDNDRVEAIHYAINLVSGSNDTIIIRNNSYIKGWAAINSYLNNSTFNVQDSTLHGVNYTNDHTYAFNVVTFDSNALGGEAHGSKGSGNVLNLERSTVFAETTYTNEYWVNTQYGAMNNVINVDAATKIIDANNDDIVAFFRVGAGWRSGSTVYYSYYPNAVRMPLTAEQLAAVEANSNFMVKSLGDVYEITSAIRTVRNEAELNAALADGVKYIILNANFSITDTVSIDYDVIIDGNGHTITAPNGQGGGHYAIQINEEGAQQALDVTIANLTLVTSGYQVSVMALGDLYDGTTTLNNVSITGDGECVYSNGHITVNAVDSTFTQNGEYVAGKDHVYYTALTVGYGGTLNAENCTVTSVNNGAAQFPSGGTIELTNTNITATTEGRYALWARCEDYASYPEYCTDSIINVYGGTITGALYVTDKYPAGHAKDVYVGDINVYGGTFRADPSYVAVEDNGTWTVVENEITITTFAELKAAIAAVNAGTSVYPTLIIANDIAFEEELEIKKSVYIKGDGEVKFIGYDASTKYDEAFYINVADEDQEITIDGIVFDHFCYYSNVANKTKATASAVKNGVAYITYGGDCPASTNLYIVDCRFIGTARDMINASSTKGCKGFIAIEDCTFDATDRLSSTLNMLSFYGNADAELNVIITGCTFKEASEQNATWATSAIASFGNADIAVVGCEFIACQIAIAIDNTFDRLFSTSTYPVYHNTVVNCVENTYTNCYYGYYEESVVASVDDIPDGAELYTDEPFTYGDEAATQFHFAAEYDLVVGGTQGVDAKYLVVACYYIAA